MAFRWKFGFVLMVLGCVLLYASIRTLLSWDLLHSPTAIKASPAAVALSSASQHLLLEYEPPKLRIGLVTSFHFSDPRVHTEFVRHTYPNRMCYARQHGYYNLFSTTPQPDKENDGVWARLAMASKWLPFMDWLLITDSDYFVVDMSRPLQSFVQEFEHVGADIHMLVPRDVPFQNDYAFSSFAILVRNTPLIQQLLSELLSLRLECPTALLWPEQQRLFIALARAIRRFHNLPVTIQDDCARQCRNPRGNESINKAYHFEHQRRLSRCLGSIAKSVGIPVGHTRDVPMVGPIAFSWGPAHVRHPNRDVGLGLNAVFGAYQNLPLVEKAFAVHVKPPNVQLKALEKDSPRMQVWDQVQHSVQQNQCVREYNNMSDNQILAQVRASAHSMRLLHERLLRQLDEVNRQVP
mmetsp:Transcript_32354/g.62193  ORF Transcript_32354/g.62193 Transcript_32354/m.62193 type:complete len:408 (-) Transcript_32354:410-1633(-)